MENFIKNWPGFMEMIPRWNHTFFIGQNSFERNVNLSKMLAFRSLFHNLACHSSERIFKFKIDYNALPYLYSYNFPFYKSLFFFISSNKRSYRKNAFSINFLKFELCNKCYTIDNKKWSIRNIENNLSL